MGIRVAVGALAKIGLIGIRVLACAPLAVRAAVCTTRAIHFSVAVRIEVGIRGVENHAEIRWNYTHNVIGFNAQRVCSKEQKTRRCECRMHMASAQGSKS